LYIESDKYLGLSKGGGKVPIGEYLELFAQLSLVSEPTSPIMLSKVLFLSNIQEQTFK
jgi:hypothetical protein